VTTLAELLGRARGAGVERLDAELLAAHVLGTQRSAIIARPERALADEDADRLAGLLAERARGVPFAYLTGTRAFHGLELAVSADVLIPRPDTETLVDAVLERLDDAPRTVADLGTGSGAIALALAAARPAWRLIATDRSPAALAVARRNAVTLGLADRVAFHSGDWYEALGGTPPLDAIVSNPPYVAPDDADLAGDVRRFEPAEALFAGADGLDAIRVIVAGAPTHLARDGLVALEHGAGQGEAVRAILASGGLRAVETVDDLAGRPRVGLGRLARGTRDG
jgi:release factor glutamine methyltransferase